MKKFRFSLSTLLKVRLEKENIARKKLQEAHLFLNNMTNALKDLEDQRDRIFESLRQKQRIAHHTTVINDHFNYLALLKKKIVNQHILIEEARYRLELQRKALIKAMQERKIIENLSEKQYAEWEYNMNEQEKIFFDELATIRFLHKR